MRTSSISDQTSFIIFISLLVINVIFVAIGSTSFPYTSLLTLIWSLFGLWRITSLALENREPNKLNTEQLTDKILDSISYDTEKKHNFILKLFSQKFFIIWIGLFLTLITWSILSSLSPKDLEFMTDINTEIKQKISNFEPTFNWYSFTISLQLIFTMLIINFTALSFSYSQRHVEKILYIIGSIFILSLSYNLFFSPFISSLFFPTIENMNGVGFGQASLIFNLNTALYTQSGSFLIYRFIETGFIGAYGFYLLLAIPLIRTLHNINKRKTIQKLALIAVIMIIIALDIFWLMNAAILLTMFLAVILTCTLWGQIEYHRLTKEQK